MNKFEHWFFNYEAHHGISTIWLFMFTLPYWITLVIYELSKEVFLCIKDLGYSYKRKVLIRLIGYLVRWV